MNQKRSSTFLEDAISLLIEHFGVDQVATALTKVSKQYKTPNKQLNSSSSKIGNKKKKNILSELSQIQEHDKKKHHILNNFYEDLKNKRVLPESQDILQFAQIIGLKEIDGRSRKVLVPKLMRFLLELPMEQLDANLKKAGEISEEDRQKGFSVLTDKLLSGKS